MKKSALIAALWLLNPAFIFASEGTEGAAFLHIPVGAGPAAMGSAYAAQAMDVYAPIYNPAGLGLLTAPQAAGQHLSYLESIHHEFLGFVLPIGGNKGLGFAAQYLGTGDIAGTDDQGQPIGDFSSSYGAYSMAYGHTLTDKLSLGLTGKWIRANLDNTSGSAFAFDLGGLYRIRNTMRVAMTLNNFGNRLKIEEQADKLPSTVHVSGAFEPSRQWTVTAEGIYRLSGLASGRLGVAWQPLEMISLRGGYRTENIDGLGALSGLSVGMGIFVWGQELAYAWLPYADLGDTHYMSLVVRFGKDNPRSNLVQFNRIKRHRTAEKAPENDAEYMQLMQLLESENQRTAENAQQPRQSQQQ